MPDSPHMVEFDRREIDLEHGRPVVASPLPDDATPVEIPRHRLTTLGAEHHRRFDCRHYDACLDYAAALAWDTFTCRPCVAAGGPA